MFRNIEATHTRKETDMRKQFAALTGILLTCAVAMSGCAGNQPAKTESTTAAAAVQNSTEASSAEATAVPAAETTAAAATDAADKGVGAENEAPVYVYLTRHGETITNRTSRMVSGRGNTPLTEEGRNVASLVGAGLSGIRFTAAYASPLGRTQETARLILDQSETSWDLNITPVEGLRELDGGSFEPMGYGELMQEHGMKFDGTVQEFQNQFYEKDETGQAESYDNAVNRAVAALKEICTETAENGGGNVLVVAHGGINGLIAATIMEDGNLDPLANSSVVLIEYKDGKYKVLSYNDQSYGEKAKARIESPEPVEVYLMVHGETVTDEQKRLNGVLDADLTEKGKEQAKETGKKLSDVEFHSVYTSDQFKDRDTARLVLSENVKNADLKEHSRMELRGVVLGYFDGELLEKAEAVSPSEQPAKARIEAFAAADPTGMVESYDSARERLVGEMKEICEGQRAKGGGDVLVVTSAMACRLIAEELDQNISAPGLKPGDFVKIVYDGNGYQVALGQ